MINVNIRRKKMIHNLKKKPTSFIILIRKRNYLIIKGTAQNKIFQKLYIRNVHLNTQNFFAHKKKEREKTCCNQGNFIFTRNVLRSAVVKIGLFSNLSFFLKPS